MSKAILGFNSHNRMKKLRTTDKMINKTDETREAYKTNTEDERKTYTRLKS